MNPNALPHQRLVSLCRNDALPHIFDVDLRHLDRLRAYDAVECHLVVYPYDRRVGSRHYAIYPYIEYLRDVSTHQRSAYAEIPEKENKVFGLAMASLIVLVALLLEPAVLARIEVLVSILGAYFLGRDFWSDIEKVLIDWSANWRISFREPYYFFEREKNPTLINYARFAKRQRYGQAHLLAEKLDYITQSNSQTLRLYFSRDDLAAADGDAAHVCSLHVERDAVENLLAGGYLLGVKLAFTRRIGPHVKRIELFQSISRGEPGCIGADGLWHAGAAYWREVIALGRVRHFLDDGLLEDVQVVEAQSK